MTSPLIPERPLLISPSLAATIGLEEACMLGILAELANFLPLTPANGRQWLDVDSNRAERMMPFWTDYDIQRISRSLHEKGVIQLVSAPFVESRRLTLSFDSTTSQTPATPSIPMVATAMAPNISQGANLIPPHWQPDQELLRQIAQYNIPQEFVWQQLPEFVTYWRERGETSHSWGAKFLKDVLHKWRNHETLNARQQREDNERQVREREADFLKRDQEIAMHSQWRPSRDALEVLVKHAGISLAFVEDSIPEFVVYWQERGEVGRTWNSKFIQHVKRQWLRYSSALEHDTEPKRIPENWQPGKDVYDVLKLANIDLKFAQQQVAEFVLFWRDSNQVYASWNTKFLQHVKYHWAKQHALTTVNSQQVNHAGQQNAHQSGRTRDSSLAEQLNDRSWAS
ncbi:DnaT-like ssDNA-binding domain-containing protein [Cellvibrio mixtus]|uniref:DnaT-like ssDNA-binding domain-containing protein n=1 Tax=Cellvibrio mixtus TaxID=39650 RepID=UPI000587F362|nr:DnaT-like ssDNA-binding domain-containing protein [Cellvibrio mixtus]